MYGVQLNYDFFFNFTLLSARSVKMQRVIFKLSLQGVFNTNHLAFTVDRKFSQKNYYHFTYKFCVV